MAKYKKNRGLQKLCDCARTKWPTCNHSWHFSFQWKNKHHRFSLDSHLGRHIESKTEAETEKDKLRAAIRAGTFGQAAPTSEMTVRELADLYLKRHVEVKRAERLSAFEGALRVICTTVVPHPTGAPIPFGTWRVTDVASDSIEQFREARKRVGTGATGTNRYLGDLRAMWAWAIRSGYATITPFKRNGEVIVTFEKTSARSRRLEHGEEGNLLKAAGPYLKAVIIAAIETGMRRGEILSLQWSQVLGLDVKGNAVTWRPKAEIFLPFAKTKTKTDRRIPISTRLKAILEMRRFDPAGNAHPPDTYVFGTEIGTRVLGFKRAWSTAVLRAHGHAPKFTDTANLTAASRAALEAINLHFHDLRREAGSRWVDGGVPLHTVRAWLGHTNIAQTSTYLAGTLQTEHDAMRRYEERSKLLVIQPGKRGSKRPRTAGTKEGKPSKTGVGREATIN